MHVMAGELGSPHLPTPSRRWGEGETEPFISVIVVTYRREQVLVDTLTYLLEQAYPRWELIVVDQTPRHDPATSSFLEAQQDRLRLIQLEEPSMTHARNVGIEAAQGEIVYFCDDDVIPVAGLLAAHARHYGDSGIGGVTGPTTIPLGARHPQACTVYRTGRVDAFRDAANASITDAAFGGNMSWRRGLLTHIGGLDEGYIRRAHREETDLSLRVRNLGFRIQYDPEAAVEHLKQPGGSRTGAEQAGYAYGWFHNSAYFYGKHFAPLGLLGFLRIQLGHIARITAVSGRPRLLTPSLRGLLDGYYAGRSSRHGSVEQPGKER